MERVSSLLTPPRQRRNLLQILGVEAVFRGHDGQFGEMAQLFLNFLSDNQGKPLILQQWLKFFQLLVLPLPQSLLDHVQLFPQIRIFLIF